MAEDFEFGTLENGDGAFIVFDMEGESGASARAGAVADGFVRQPSASPDTGAPREINSSAEFTRPAWHAQCSAVRPSLSTA